ncbi:MAG: [NiFe]-hydrogenase assembly chaperone HybE [Pseudomonadota bacterium]
MSVAFESSVAGRLNADAVLECGVCWYAYDPADGDETRDVPPGTPFAALPDDWRCPCCDAAPSKFMVKDGGGLAAARAGATMADRLEALERAYRQAEKAIVGLPVHNGALDIALVGFRPHGDAFVGVVTTPWCMNVASLPQDPDAPAPGALGSKRQHAFPSGGYTFVLGRMEGVGFVETCSLFSPMDEFADHAATLAAAQAAVDGLFEYEEPPAPEKVSRRFVLTRNGKTA